MLSDDLPMAIYSAQFWIRRVAHRASNLMLKARSIKQTSKNLMAPAAFMAVVEDDISERTARIRFPESRFAQPIKILWINPKGDLTHRWNGDTGRSSRLQDSVAFIKEPKGGWAISVFDHMLRENKIN